MRITPEEAQASLLQIERIKRETRRSLALHGTGSILMAWGLVWMTCFLLNHYYPAQAIWIWNIGNGAGVLLTITVLAIGRRTIRTKSGRRRNWNWKFFWFWFSLFAFLNASMAVLLDQPPSWKRLTAFVTLGIMFAYVVIGLMLDTWFMIILGLMITVLILVGFFALHEYFYLWMAFTGGGALFFSGLHVHRAWR